MPIRAAIRLSLIRATGRPLVLPPLPERDVTLATLGDSKSGTSRADTIAQKAPQTPDHIKNNHSLFQSPSTSTPNPLLVPTASNTLPSVDDFLLAKALKPSALCAPTRLIAHLATPSEWVVEIIYILRPLFYGAFVFRAQLQERRWNYPAFFSAVHRSVIEAKKSHLPSDSCLTPGGSFTAISAKASVAQSDVGAS